MSEVLRGLIFPIAMFVILYFTLIRPQKKRDEEKNEMINNLKVGDKIVTIGGIRGKVVVVKEDIITIETSTANTRLELNKWAIGAVL